MTELRNLSCTPLFSKVLESFVLQKLKNEVSLSGRQFGGIKGCSTDHFLLETWDAVITALEDGSSAANLLSVDFEKAFNRMDHFKCLQALSGLRAKQVTISWVASFLYNRQMSVKIRNSFSVPRCVPGGSPQGSILGNFLFCATTDSFAKIKVDNEARPDSSGGSFSFNSAKSTFTSSPGGSSLYNSARSMSSPLALASTPTNAISTPTVRGQFANFRPPRNLLNLSEELQSDEDEFEFFRAKKRYSFDTSSGSSSSDSLSKLVIPNTLCPEPLKTMVYIDDFNSIEKVNLREVESHTTVNKRQINALAQKSETLFEKVRQLATSINMRVNCKKTQMLCISASHFNEVNSYIRTEDGDLKSGNNLKILGFQFSSEPNANYHVSNLIDKMYGKLWTLRFLKRSGMSKDKLLEIYKTVLRPSAEYSSVVYDSLIPEYLSEKLEAIQRQAIRIIYGYDVDYGKIVEDGEIETLKKRREDNVLKFALKAEESARFGQAWFRETPPGDREVRQTTRNRYLERQCSTERGRNNPIQVMTRRLNEHYRG